MSNKRKLQLQKSVPQMSTCSGTTFGISLSKNTLTASVKPGCVVLSLMLLSLRSQLQRDKTRQRLWTKTHICKKKTKNHTVSSLGQFKLSCVSENSTRTDSCPARESNLAMRWALAAIFTAPPCSHAKKSNQSRSSQVVVYIILDFESEVLMLFSPLSLSLVWSSFSIVVKNYTLNLKNTFALS